MPSQPWVVHNPKTSVTHFIPTLKYGREFARERNLRYENFQELLAPESFRQYRAGSRKAHSEGWVHKQDIKWLYRDGLLAALPTVGPTFGLRNVGDIFFERVVRVRPDMHGMSIKQLRSLLTNGAPVKVGAFTWRLVPPPANADAVLSTGWAYDKSVKLGFVI